MLHEPPALFLHTTLRRIENHQLASLLKFGVAKDKVLTLVVIVKVFGRILIGMDPLGG
jgi:hypothetical protein